MVIFEQPLNEQIRACLRLEHLFQDLEQYRVSSETVASQTALVALLRMLEVMDRPDLKAKLAQLLHQQITNLTGLMELPQVDRNKLTKLLAELDSVEGGFNALPTKLGESLRQHPFLKPLRVHLNNPGGLCPLGNPSYRLWLQQGERERMSWLATWAEELHPIMQVIDASLKLIRETGSMQSVTAETGVYQHTLEPTVPYPLIRVGISPRLNMYPEISVGRHRVYVRFRALEAGRSKTPSELPAEIAFKLACCKL